MLFVSWRTIKLNNNLEAHACGFVTSFLFTDVCMRLSVWGHVHVVLDHVLCSQSTVSVRSWKVFCSSAYIYILVWLHGYGVLELVWCSPLCACYRCWWLLPLKVDPVDSEKTIQYADASAERTPQPQEPDENELEPEMSDPQLLRRLKSELMDLDEAGPEQIQAQQDDETGWLDSIEDPEIMRDILEELEAREAGLDMEETQAAQGGPDENEDEFEIVEVEVEPEEAVSGAPLLPTVTEAADPSTSMPTSATGSLPASSSTSAAASSSTSRPRSSRRSRDEWMNPEYEGYFKSNRHWERLVLGRVRKRAGQWKGWYNWQNPRWDLRRAGEKKRHRVSYPWYCVKTFDGSEERCCW